MPDELKAKVIVTLFGSQDAAADWFHAVQHSPTAADAAAKVRRATLTSIRDAYQPEDSLARRLDPVQAEELLAVVSDELARRGDDETPSMQQMTHDWMSALETAPTPAQAVAAMMTPTLERMLAFLDHPRVAAVAEGMPLADDHHARVTAIREELTRRGVGPPA